jgi:hypothetical protein
MVNVSIFYPQLVYANDVVRKSLLSPEQINKAQDSANKTMEDAFKKARESGGYGYDIGEIVRTVIFNIIWLVVYSIFIRKFYKYRLVRILFVPMCLVWVFLGFFLSIFVIN